MLSSKSTQTERQTDRHRDRQGERDDRKLLTDVEMDDVMHYRRLNNDTAHLHISTKVDVIWPFDTYVYRLNTSQITDVSAAHQLSPFPWCNMTDRNLARSLVTDSKLTVRAVQHFLC